MPTENDPQAAAAATPEAAPADATRLATLERENADLKDRLLRALAEMENLRRRAERDMLDARAYAITKFAGDIIGTADNLRRALEALPKPDEGKEAPDLGPLKAMVDGVELTERDLLKALEKHGVKRRAPVGEKFDPHKDQAVFEIPDETVVSGTVLQVMQAGYSIGERVLRPAMVGVSRGGPARMPEAAPAQPAAEAAPEMAAPPPPPRPPEPPRPQGDASARPKVDKRA
jgi:molecular chaperone GrpE